MVRQFQQNTLVKFDVDMNMTWNQDEPLGQAFQVLGLSTEQVKEKHEAFRARMSQRF